MTYNNRGSNTGSTLGSARFGLISHLSAPTDRKAKAFVLSTPEARALHPTRTYKDID